MRKINLLLTAYSLTALVIIIERILPTTKVLLQPNNFIRLHEIIQTAIFLPITIVISFLILWVITERFKTLQTKRSLFLLILFFLGTYLFGAGEGWHEVASFTLNQYCNSNNPIGNLCQGLFINDYYAGNIIFFVGGLFMNFSLLSLSSKNPVKRFENRDLVILFANSLVYAFTWFAYAAFDKVLVGLFFSALLMVISILFLLGLRGKLREYPYILYGAIAYTLATFGTIIVRFR